MTSKELKLEIQKSLDNVPNGVLQEILVLLKQAEGKPDDQARLMLNLRKILEVDRNLLARLC